MIGANVIAAPCKLDALLSGFAPASDVGLSFAHISQDSRKVIPGSLFLAVPGSQKHGAEYIDDAIAQGAAAVLVDLPGSEKITWRGEVPVVQVHGLAEHASEIAGRLYAEPSKALWVAGITGTNGKTSCAWWLQQLLNLSGAYSASLGTLGTAIGAEIIPDADGLTTADAVGLQRRLAELKNEGLDSVVLEVSSHGLDQHRVDGVAFDLAIFTNLTQDHLDYHGDLDSYASAKKRLFDLPGLNQSLINIDDEFGRKLAALQSDSVELFTYSLFSADADFHILSDVQYPGISADVVTPWGSVGIVNSSIFGEHNLSNLLCVIAAAAIKGVSLDQISQGISQLSPVPGRLERVSGDQDDVEVIVDFAHTPDAVSKTLESLKRVSRGRRWVLLGAGGDRDRSKRPLMAKAASAFADRLIVTNDNPRGEDPGSIACDLISGVEQDASVEIILDRGEAIFSAIERAAPGDCIAILGKGHESYQIIGSEKLPFLDAEVAVAALEKRRGMKA